MAFNTRAQNNTQSSGSSSQSTVDWAEVDKYRVETAGLQDPETLPGYVSMIVDLGIQEQEPAQLEWTGTEEEKEKRMADFPSTYFKMIDGKEHVCWPNKPQQCVAIAVDFPDIKLNLSQFFNEDGEQEELPLRLWLGGQFFFKGHGMCVSNPASLRVVNLNKDRKGTPIWSLAQNNVLYRMAVGAKLIKNGEAFLPERIDELLGKSFQFAAQVYFNNKGYYTEYLKFVGGLARGQEELELETEPMLLQFTEDNDEAALSTVRSHVINTMRRSVEFEGSNIQKQLDAVRGQNNSPNDDSDQGDKQPAVEPEQEAPVKEKAKAPAKKVFAKKPVVDDSILEEDLPFS
jgi:hypothetical protein